MNIIFLRKGILVERITSCLFLAMALCLCVSACSKDSSVDEPDPPYETPDQGGPVPILRYVIYRLSGDYSDNVPVSAYVQLQKGGERIIGSIYGEPDYRPDGTAPVMKLNDGYHYTFGNRGYSPYAVYLTLKYSEYINIADVDKANRPGKYGYAIMPEARVIKSYSIEEEEFWRIAEELYPEDKEEYGPYWGNIFMTDTFEKTMNRLIDDGLPGFELVYDETTYDPETDADKVW